MNVIRLSDSDVEFMCNALSTARNVYKSHASTLRDTRPPGFERLAEQFDRQVADTNRLDALFQDAPAAAEDVPSLPTSYIAFRGKGSNQCEMQDDALVETLAAALRAAGWRYDEEFSDWLPPQQSARPGEDAPTTIPMVIVAIREGLVQDVGFPDGPVTVITRDYDVEGVDPAEREVLTDEGGEQFTQLVWNKR